MIWISAGVLKDLLNILADSVAEAATSSGIDPCQCPGDLQKSDCHLLDFHRTIDSCPFCSGRTIAITIVFMGVKIQFMAVIVNCFAGLLQLS